MGQQLLDGPHNLATLTFDLEGHGARLWYGSSRFICVLSLKFVGLPVRKILHIYYVSTGARTNAAKKKKMELAWTHIEKKQMTVLPDKHYSGHRGAREIDGHHRTRGKEIWRKK